MGEAGRLGKDANILLLHKKKRLPHSRATV